MSYALIEDDDLPEPLTPEDCDLRTFPFLPLDCARFRDSDLASLPDAEARWANVVAWTASWHQLPAGSLPDDDAALCRLLGYGRDVGSWKTIRAAGGLRGWIKCRDGRLYHPVVAEKVLAAWEKKNVQRRRSQAGNTARWGNRAASAPPSAAASFADPMAVAEGSLKDDGGSPSGIPGPSQQTRTQIQILESENLPLNPRKRGRAAGLQGFDEFWKVYPRRVGKGAAERAWPKALAEAGGDPNEIVWALQARLHQFDDREGGRFIPHPATWLNAKRWLDGEES